MNSQVPKDKQVREPLHKQKGMFLDSTPKDFLKVLLKD